MVGAHQTIGAALAVMVAAATGPVVEIVALLDSAATGVGGQRPEPEIILAQMRPPSSLDGLVAVSTEKRPLMRLVGCQSYTRHIGELLGGQSHAMDRMWFKLSQNQHHLKEVRGFIPQHELGKATEDEALLAKRSIDFFIPPPDKAEKAKGGLDLLRAIAKELHGHRGEGGLHACWAW